MESSENILCTSTYFIGSDNVAKKFDEELVDYLILAQEKADSENLQIKFTLKLTIVYKEKEGWGVTENASKFLDNAFLKLRNAKIDYWLENWPSGPTRSEYSALFDIGVLSSKFKAVVLLNGLDQFSPNENIETIKNLYDSMKENNSLLVTGSRNLPVVLSANKENGYLRRIMEGFLNLTIKQIYQSNKNKIIFPKGKNTGDKQYNFHRDLIAGVLLINPNHPRYLDLLSDILKISQENNFFGFEGEYYLLLSVGGYGDLSVVYSNNFPNPFENEEVKKEKQKIIEKQIKTPLSKLKNTSVASYLVETIKGVGREGLLEYYPKEQVDEVSRYMLEVLE